MHVVELIGADKLFDHCISWSMSPQPQDCYSCTTNLFNYGDW